MTAVLLFTVLVAGISTYVEWAIHWIAQGASPWWFVAGAPLAYLAPVAVLVAVWFVLSWIWRTPRPPNAQLDVAGSVRLFIGEVLAVAISWPLMALHRLLIRDPLPASVQLPVILVHGVLVNDGVWFTMRRHLARQAVGAVYTINYGPPFGDIEHFAEQLGAKIESVCAATGAARVFLVCHSMGGLVARAYLRQRGPSRIERIITIGTPHHGSVFARGIIGRCLAQMRPGNAWLAELNRDEAKPPPVPITSIWSRHDSLVAPQASSELACAENIALVGVGHNALLGDVRVKDLVTQDFVEQLPSRC
ncbi:MAG TPA: alpha/beta fold hydrolase [Casimicrobiaceae bacterium]|nr:alpha/beta fold hydrolase [Casimicrobiaceae bacterium]